MAANGKEYKLAIRIAGIVDKSYDVALTSASASMKGFKATMTNIDGAFKELDKGFDKVMRVGKTCFHAIATAAGVATVAVGAVTAAAIKLGSDFEAEMSTVQSISGATAQEMVELSEKAREVAKNTVFSATEVGSAMEYMGMAGWKANQMIAGLDGVIALAAASGEDLAMVSDIVTDSLTAMGETAEQSTHFADILAQAAMNSNTNVELMGESFKYAAPVAGALEYSMEDLTIAIGLMASSGIKGSLAGTALRNMLTRMAKPTKESRDAMDALGLSLTDDEGRMYSLLEIMQMLRQNFAEGTDTEKMQQALMDLAGLTDEQIEEVQSSLGDLSAAEEAFYAAELGGQRGMSGLLAIANSTDEEFLKLTDAIYNAEGAAEQMSKIRLDNLQGDVTILKDTVSDAGIELYYQFNTQLRGLIQKVTEFAGTIAGKIPSAFRKISEAFPTLKRKFTQYAKPVFDAGLSVGKWVIKHGRGIISILAGIGAAMAAYKIASNTSHLITSIMKLASMGPVGWVILGVTAAIAALTTAIVAYKQHERELIDNSLETHFGNLALSMEELQKVAEYITATDNLGQLKEALDAFGDLEQYEQTINDTVDTLNRMNWMVSIGMELDADDQESYKQAIQDYVDAAQNYALQGRYAVSLSLTAVFDLSDLEQSNIVTQIDNFYSDKYDELEELGKQLNEAVTEAFNDGLLEIDEVEKIRQIQQQMAEIQQALALGEYDAVLASIGLEFSGAALDSDTFQNLQAELQTAANDVSDTYRETYQHNQASINAAHEAGYLTDEQYEAASQQAANQMTSGIAQTNLQAIRFQINSIYDAYGDEIKAYQDELNSLLNEYSQESYTWDWQERPGVMWDGLIDSMEKSNAVSTADKKAIEELLEGMTDQIAEIDALTEQWDSLTPETQEQLAEVRRQLETLRGLTARRGDNLFGWGEAGDIAGLYANLANTVMDDDQYALIKDWVDDYYEEYTGYSYEQAQQAAQQAAQDTQTLIDESFAPGFNVNASVGVTLNPFITNPSWSSNLPSLSQFENESPYDANGNLKGPYSNEYINAWNAAHPNGHANGGLVMDKELSWLAEKGPEMVVPLDGSDRAVSLWEQAGQLLGMSSLSDRYDLDGATQQTVSVEYSPTLQFYGQAPAKEDLDEALRMSQEEFNEMMENYLSGKRRVSFA